MEAQPSAKNPPPFGRYVIRERMAEGGMGEVFLAVAVGADGFEKPVVIKRLLPKFAGRADIVSLLAAEAKLMTRLIHPNIVQVIDFGRGDKDDYFVVMELVSGTNFGKFRQAYAARGERMPIPVALYVMSQVLRGLAYAHSNASTDGERLVHRDISPGNILLSTFGEVKVGDFGVALVGGSTGEGGGDGWIVGKPAYMAPEQLSRAAVDERADIYAVGAVLFQAITGVLHRGDIAPGATDVPLEITPAARAALAEAASPDVGDIVLRALAPEREGRYADAREMARAIEQLTEKGQRIATADQLAEAVSLAVEHQPSQTKSVVLLSGDDDALFGSGTELTRIDSGDKHGFTLKISEPPAPAHASPPAPAHLPPPTEGPSSVDVAELAASLGPHRRRWAGIGIAVVGALALAAGLLARGARDASGRDEHTSNGAAAPPGQPSPHHAAAGPATTATTPSEAPAETPPAERPVARSGASTAPSRKGEAHSRTKETSSKESAAREPAPPSSSCRGQLHLYATHGWLLSGGPGSVQAPGRYDWPCGTYGLKAVSRTDASQVRNVTVTIREGTPGVVDLR